MFDSKYNTRPNDPNFVDWVSTPITEVEAAYYLREGWKKLYNEYPSKDSLAILWAQTALETGRYKSLFRNYNFGNIKKNMEYSDHWTSYECGEFYNGVHEMFYPYHPETFFAAWLTPLSGAEGYIKFLSRRTRYKKAWQELIKGDPLAYAVELRNGGYYTAPVEKYSKTLIKLVNEFKSRYDEMLEFKPKSEEIKESTELKIKKVSFIDIFKFISNKS